jgi:CoA:oxalate CoA-transferase
MVMPLEGIKIIDCTQAQFGPVGTAMLADLGADVIKIEHPKQGDIARGAQALYTVNFGLPYGRNFYFENNNRGKRGITIDLSKKEGQEIIYHLIKTADVFVNNWRKGVAARLHLDYQTLSQINPKLIYAWGSAFGPDGPDSDKPGYDPVAQARSGFMTAVGEPDMPPLRVNGAIADQTGGIILGYAIVTALLARERQGIGQEVDVSILGSLMQVQGLNIAARCMLGLELPRIKRLADTNPINIHYQCADGKWLIFSMLQSDRYWPDFCAIVGIQDLQNNPKFNSAEARKANCTELILLLEKVFAGKPRSEWIKIFDEGISQGRDIIYSIVNSIADLPDDPQILANDYITTFNHPVYGDIKVMGLPYKFSKTPGAPGGSKHREAPEFGQHTEEVLLEYGYTWDDITKLREQGVF